MGHTRGLIHQGEMPVTTTTGSWANRQALRVDSGDGRSSTGHGVSLINTADTITSGHGEGVNWDRRWTSANIFGRKTPYNLVSTGHGRGMTGEGMGLRSGDNFFGSISCTTDGCNCNMEN